MSHSESSSFALSAVSLLPPVYSVWPETKQEKPQHREGSCESSSDFITLAGPLQPGCPCQAPGFHTCCSLCNTPSQPGSSLLLTGSFQQCWASLVAQVVKNPPAMWDTPARSLGQEDPLEKGVYPLQYSWASLVSQLVKNLPAMWETWVQSLRWEDPLEKGKATPVFWPGEFHGLCSPWEHRELDITEQLS